MKVTQDEAACREAQRLFLALLADDLTQQDTQRVTLHIAHCADCSERFDETKRILYQQHNGSKMHSATTSDEKRSSLLITIAWIVIIASGLVIAGFLLWDLALALWTDNSQPVWLRAFLAIFYAGFAFLFLVILRQRLTARKTDKFRQVKK